MYTCPGSSPWSGRCAKGSVISLFIYFYFRTVKLSYAKNYPNLNGVKINDKEFLLSQYADDSSLVLEDDPKSLDNSIKLFHKFTECAG